ncbi:MAG: hypothetical protein ACYS5V_14275 [Planctomycetota bacterium]|jgi:hypothetical protein
MRNRKTIAVLLGVSLVTVMVVGYAVAQDRRPPRGGPMMGPGARRPGMADPGMGGGRGHAPHVVQQMTMMLHLIERMRDAAFDPETAGIMAVAGMKDDVRRSPREAAEDLEKQLARTKTLGLRNAIRMSLKDIYKRVGEDEKVLQQLRAMLAENDKALQEEDEDDEDDE